MPSQITSQEIGAKPTPPTKPSFSLRIATPADAAQIAHVGSSTFAATFGWSLPPHDLAAYLEDSYSIPAITADLENRRMQFLVAYEPTAPNIVLGFAQLTEGSKEPVIDDEPDKFPAPIELQRFYVLMGRAGQGIGKALVREIERIARNMGRKTLWLGVW